MARKTKRRTRRKINFEAIPVALKELDQWVGWKGSKIPLNIRTGAAASSTDPKTWSSFKAALKAYQSGRIDGIGFVFSEDDPYVGIDLDKCRNPETGKPKKWAAEIIRDLDSYTEVSPSGEGYHVLIKGTIPGERRRKGGIEMYDCERYFTITGHHLKRWPTVIKKRQKAITRLYEQTFPQKIVSSKSSTGLRYTPRRDGSLTNQKIIDYINKNDDGRKLWNGQLNGHSSQSEADLALCSHIAFYTGNDPNRIAQLFRQSGLGQRDKAGRDNYLLPTIEKSLEGKNEFYGEKKPSKKKTRKSSKRMPSIDTLALKLQPHANVSMSMSVNKVNSQSPFPVNSLPKKVAKFVNRASKSIACDSSYLALPILSAAASSIGNSRCVQLKPGWTEPAVLWTAIIGESGTHKSPAMDASLHPIRRLQAKLVESFDHAIDAWLQLSREEKSKTPKPVCHRIIVGDTTIEALTDRLADNPRGVLLARDELAGWIESHNQYKGGTGGDTAHWLAMHRAGDLIVDRKSGDKQTIFVARAAVSITGGIQPAVLARSLGHEHFEDGLAARLLLAMPPRKAKKWTEAEISEADERSLSRIYHQLRQLNPDEDDDGGLPPFPVTLNKQAKRLWIEFFNDHAKEQTELTGDLAAAWSKLEGYCARLALIIHLLRWASREEVNCSSIDQDSMQSAITLIEWFKNETRRVYALLAETDEDRELRELVELIRRKGGRITVRKLMRSVFKFKKSDEAEEALNELKEAGFGKWKTVSTKTKKRREFVLIDTH